MASPLAMHLPAFGDVSSGIKSQSCSNCQVYFSCKSLLYFGRICDGIGCSVVSPVKAFLCNTNCNRIRFCYRAWHYSIQHFFPRNVQILTNICGNKGWAMNLSQSIYFWKHHHQTYIYDVQPVLHSRYFSQWRQNLHTDAGFTKNQVWGHQFDTAESIDFNRKLEGLQGSRNRSVVLPFEQQLLAFSPAQFNHLCL